MMKMVKYVSVDMETKCKKFETALNRFFKKHPEIDDAWRETFEYMHENGLDFFSDKKMADGTENKNWCYALHLDEYDDGYFYLAVIEREFEEE